MRLRLRWRAWMNTLHSGSVWKLFVAGHVDVPRQKRGRVECDRPPFGWEMCAAIVRCDSWRKNSRQMGATLRYDLPGRATARADARDPGLFESWIQSGGRRRNCATRRKWKRSAVSGFIWERCWDDGGVALERISGLVLWTSAKGRSVLAELRAVANVALEYLSEQEAPRNDSGF